MKIAVVYASKTGNTRRAAELIGTAMEERGNTVSVQSVDALDFKALADAELVVLGTWVAGHFVIAQKPGDARRLAKVPALTGKPVALFMTYAINPGKALGKFEKALTAVGADVVGGYAWKRSTLPAGIESFVDGILSATATTSA